MPVNDENICFCANVDKFCFTTKEAAEFLGVSPQTLTNWRNLGKGPAFIRLSGHGCIRYLLDDLLSFLRSCKKVCPVPNKKTA